MCVRGRDSNNQNEVKQVLYSIYDRLLIVFTQILTGNCRPARAERETAFAFDLPESLPALPPAYS